MENQCAQTLLNLPKVNRSLASGSNLYSLSRSIALHAVVSSQEPPKQRKYPRYRPDTKMYAFHSTLGAIKDISMDGLSYTYYQLPGTPAESLPKTGTLFSSEWGTLKNIPFRVIHDTVSIQPAPYPELKQRQITFGELTAEQCEKLEDFILKHVKIPQPDINTEHCWFREPKLAHVKREYHHMYADGQR